MTALSRHLAAWLREHLPVDRAAIRVRLDIYDLLRVNRPFPVI